MLATLRALKEQDKSRYALKLKPYLDLKSDPAVVYLALQWCGKWALENYLDEISMIADKARQENLRKLAKEFLGTL